MPDDDSDLRAAGWKRDPSRRFAGRYWDGERWTDHVVSAGHVVSVDVIGDGDPALRTRLAAPPPSSAPPAPPTAPIVSVGPAGGAPPAGQPSSVQRAWTTVRGWPRWAPWTAAAVVALLIWVAGTGDGGDPPRTSVPEISVQVPGAPTTAPAPATTTPTAPAPAPDTTPTLPAPAPAATPVGPTTTQAATASTTPLVTNPEVSTSPTTAPPSTPSSTSPENNMMTTTGFSAVDAG